MMKATHCWGLSPYLLKTLNPPNRRCILPVWLYTEMAAITFLPPANTTKASQYSTVWRTSEEDWEPFKARIRQLYLEEDKPLKDVMAIMERDYGFKATSGSQLLFLHNSHLMPPQCEDVQKPHNQMEA